jgi:hypothetical protein
MAGLVPFLMETWMGYTDGNVKTVKTTTTIVKFFGGICLYRYIPDLLNYFCYFTEDLCLFLLCRDFRRMFVFPFFCRKPRTNAIAPEQMISLPATQMVEENGEQIS